jgi:hypothetical protein
MAIAEAKDSITAVFGSKIALVCVACKNSSYFLSMSFGSIITSLDQGALKMSLPRELIALFTYYRDYQQRRLIGLFSDFDYYKVHYRDVDC